MTGLEHTEYDRHAALIQANTTNYPELIKLRNQHAMDACWHIDLHTTQNFAIDFAKDYARLARQAQDAIFKLLLSPDAYRLAHNPEEQADLS